jgi:hypothetical protein
MADNNELKINEVEKTKELVVDTQTTETKDITTTNDIPDLEKQEKVTAEDILRLKEEYEASRRKELEEVSKTYEEQMAELKAQLEEIKLANMKEEERRAYELKKKEEEAIEERNRIIEENKRLKAEKERAINEAYIKEQFAKYKFIPAKYHKIMEGRTKEDFESFFTIEVLEDLKELHTLRDREKSMGTNAMGLPGNTITEDGKVVNPFSKAVEEKKNELLKQFNINI